MCQHLPAGPDSACPHGTLIQRARGENNPVNVPSVSVGVTLPVTRLHNSALFSLSSQPALSQLLRSRIYKTAVTFCVVRELISIPLQALRLSYLNTASSTELGTSSTRKVRFLSGHQSNSKGFSCTVLGNCLQLVQICIKASFQSRHFVLSNSVREWVDAQR